LKTNRKNLEIYVLEFCGFVIVGNKKKPAGNKQLMIANDYEK
jgi:hypothetical protein